MFERFPSWLRFSCLHTELGYSKDPFHNCPWCYQCCINAIIQEDRIIDSLHAWFSKFCSTGGLNKWRNHSIAGWWLGQWCYLYQRQGCDSITSWDAECDCWSRDGYCLADESFLHLENTLVEHLRVIIPHPQGQVGENLQPDFPLCPPLPFLLFCLSLNSLQKSIWLAVITELIIKQSLEYFSFL